MGFADVQLRPGPIVTQPTVESTLGQELDVVVSIVDENDSPVDLTPYVGTYPDSDAEAPCRSRAVPISTGVLFVARSHRMEQPATLTREAEIEGDPCEGNVRITLLPCDFTYPGLYLAELGFFEEAKLQFSYSMYLEVAPSLQWSTKTAGPLTIAEVRLWVRDNSPSDNFLLDEVEFKDTEIIAAIRRAVDMWNETPPMMVRYTYDATTFPFRSQWIALTVALLKGIAYHWYLRNDMKYSAGGVNIDDMGKWRHYREESMLGLKQFTDWAAAIKPQLNAGQAWSRVGFQALP